MVARRLSFPLDAFVREAFLRCLGSQIFREIDGSYDCLVFFSAVSSAGFPARPLSGFGGQISLETAFVVLEVSREPPFFGGLAA